MKWKLWLLVETLEQMHVAASTNSSLQRNKQLQEITCQAREPQQEKEKEKALVILLAPVRFASQVQCRGGDRERR